MSVGYGVPWRSLHPKNNPISPSVVTTMGLLVLLLFQTSVDGIIHLFLALQTEKQGLLFHEWKTKLGMAS